MTASCPSPSGRRTRGRDPSPPRRLLPRTTPRVAATLLALAGAAVLAAPASATPEVLSPTPDWSFETDLEWARLGWHVETAGDVNGDGYDDVIAGAFLYANGQDGEGAALLFLGSPGGPASTPSWLFECDQLDAQCGWSVASAGDVNGDGYDDVLVGARLWDGALVDEGGAFLFYGSPTGLPAAPSWTATGGQAGAMFNSVSGIGDVNGDGFDDVALGNVWFQGPQTDEGRILVFHGSSGGPGTSPDWVYESDRRDSGLGQATAAGDVNGDGFGDLLISAFQYDNGETNEGKAWVFLGGSSGLDAAPVWSAESDQAGAQFGLMSNTAGDVNGDGYDDVIIVADLFTSPEPAEGAAFVWHGGPGGLIVNGIPGTPSNADWSVESDANFSYLRWGDTAGDVNGDGFDDVIVGEGLFPESQRGRARVFLGSAGGLRNVPAWTALGPLPGSRFGWSAESAGDVNGDGLGDVIVGAERYSNGEYEEGAAFVFLGREDSVCTDGDGDGYGSPGSWTCPAGPQDDCRDGDPISYPGAMETCDGRDNDCDGLTDEDAAGEDSDGDLIPNLCDNCPGDANPGQQDQDFDGVGNACDNCLTAANPLQEDYDQDLRGDACDNCPVVPNPLQGNSDADSLGDACDNCPTTLNEDQSDMDSDFQGDVCDLDDGEIVLELPSSAVVVYQLEAGYSSFNIYRSSLGHLQATGEYTQDPAQVPEADRFCQQTSGSLPDSFAPAPGELLLYLATGWDGAEETLGADGLGNLRPNDNPCR